MLVNQVIAALVAAGGMGFVNYVVADKLDLIDFSDEKANLRIPYMLCWSVPDFTLYLLIKQLISKWIRGELGIALSLIVTLISVYVVSLLFSRPLFWLSGVVINWIRSEEKADLFSGSPWNRLLGTSKEQMVYIYNFEKEPIVCGYLEFLTIDPGSRTEMSVVPFTNSKKQLSFQEVHDYYSTFEKLNEYGVQQYLDFDRKIIIVVITPTS
ncbi:hypothetical protein [Levilactobacillus brevis]|uniref:hypothetical protein n=1 Tax=Levilactobacillus brevis TaxID=1580 RepID=UPI0021A3FCB9|nr:hypothetical protein [Levilactobacillus brevis]MCT3574132.1 hypothetical protein [Levilactobacillus brevis]